MQEIPGMSTIGATLAALALVAFVGGFAGIIALITQI